ncbi:competence protein CoiA [Acinetobacter beijerinckii]|uniref:competence protein CoiA n=1 Tax=Acinetobacter beijerinckii TaxID=262668 RepID=UPI00300B7F9E
MGFISIIEEKEIYSFMLDDEQWSRLKEKYKNLNMYMPCCDTKAIPKKNKLGTQFFAHHPSNTCEFSSGESREHQLCKYLILKHLHENGWKVFPEYRGQTPDGEIWIADIYAEKEQSKIVIEIQWSYQSIEETERRQEKYKASGIRAIWFMRTTLKNKWDVLDYQSYELPIFSISLDKESHQLIASGAFKNCDSFDLVEKEFIQFFQHLMSGGIQHSLKPNAQRFLRLGLNQVRCWKCNQITNTIMEINYFIHYKSDLTKIAELTIEHLSSSHSEILNNPKLMQKYTYGFIIKRFSKTRGTAYLSNGCFHCDALQGAFFAHHEKTPNKMKYSEYIEVRLDKDSKVDDLWYYL